MMFVFQGFLQQLRQIAGRMSSGPRGAGLGVKLLIGAGALAYGVKEATYTGLSTYLNVFVKFNECFSFCRAQTVTMCVCVSSS